MYINPLLTIDAYKIGHKDQYPIGTTVVYSNLTPRTGAWKKSAKGLLSVKQIGNKLVLSDSVTPEDEESSLLQTVFENGKLYNEQTFIEIRNRVHNIMEKYYVEN